MQQICESRICGQLLQGSSIEKWGAHTASEAW